MKSLNKNQSISDSSLATNTVIADIVQEHWGIVVAALARTLGDLQIAEDVLQESLIKALEIWPREGIPDKASAWLYTTSKRNAIDYFRRNSNFQDKQPEILKYLLESQSYEDELDYEIPDERLRLIFTCCHPSIGQQSQVALTLKTLLGYSTESIARAFLVSEKTMFQRLVRAKKKIREAGIPYEVPDRSVWNTRLSSVLEVIYLIYNEEYSAHSPGRVNLASEAMRLGQILEALIPDEPEVMGLLSLMLLHESRKKARYDGRGRSVSLELQDRSLWNQLQIRQGDALLRKALVAGDIGPYQLQAAISAIHSSSPSFQETDWRQIHLLYSRLYQLKPSEVIRLNGLVALSFSSSPEIARDALLAMEGEEISSYQPFYAAKADILRRCGNLEGASQAYDRAIELSHNEADKHFLASMKLSLKSKKK